MTDVCLLPGEQLDDLQLNGLKIIQSKDLFRYGTDAVLLADFASARPGMKIADFGTGTGVLPLLISGRAERTQFYAFEIQPASAELARRNAALNHMTDAFQVFCADLREAPKFVGHHLLDLVVCNPPYYANHAGQKSAALPERIARHEADCSLAEIASAAAAVLKTGGKLAMILPAARLAELMQAMQNTKIEPKRMQLVYPKAGREANLVLLEGTREAKPMLRVLEPLIACNPDGSMTAQMKKIYHIPE